MPESSRIAAENAGTLTIHKGRSVNRLGFGGMRLCGPGVWGWPQDRANAENVLRRAVELGVNFIDTADAYGPAVNEEQIANALYPYPGGLIIATKGGCTRGGPGDWGRDCRPERLKRCCDESLARLRVDAIDLYQLHAVDDNVPFEEQVGALKDLQDAGKIRSVGLSNVSLEQVKHAERIVPIASVQNRYNVGDRSSESIVEYCEQRGSAFIPYFPVGGGDIETLNSLSPIAKAHGATVWQVAIAWLLQRSPIMLPIPGTSSIAHLEENIAAASLRLTTDEFELLANLG